MVQIAFRNIVKLNPAMGNAKDDYDIKAFNGAVVNCVIQQIVGILYSPATPRCVGQFASTNLPFGASARFGTRQSHCPHLFLPHKCLPLYYTSTLIQSNDVIQPPLHKSVIAAY
jgi:hypothetical protein